ncbi:MAG: DUF1365 domain-containing protein [Acidobacteriota bacterium]
MLTLESALYIGTLRHRRFAPKSHQFTYPVFQVFLDIDHLPELMAASALTSYNRFNWAAFHERDHFGDATRSLRDRVTADAARNGVDLPGGKIFLLTNLRYLGYVFNPVSFFYCYDEAGELRHVLAAVNNTFGESHNYWVRPGGRCAKELHVSPFFAMQHDYRFRLPAPGTSLTAHMDVLQGESPCFDATLTLFRRAWNAGEIRRALLRFPFTTAKVTAAIHWEAARLWWKGIPIFTHPDRTGAASNEGVEEGRIRT